jgi:hypothetical protein
MLKSGEPTKIPARDHYARRNPLRTTNRLVAQLERLGRTVTLREPLDSQATRFASGHQRHGLLDAQSSPSPSPPRQLAAAASPRAAERTAAPAQRPSSPRSLPQAGLRHSELAALIEVQAGQRRHHRQPARGRGRVARSDESRTRAAVALRLRVAVATRSSIVYAGVRSDLRCVWWTCGESSCVVFRGAVGCPPCSRCRAAPTRWPTGRFEGSATVCCAAV